MGYKILIKREERTQGKKKKTWGTERKKIHETGKAKNTWNRERKNT